MIHLVVCLLLTGCSPSIEPKTHLVQEEHIPVSDALKLTRPDGTPVWVNPRAIAFVRGPLEGEQGHTTLVFTSGAKQAVTESVEEIITLVTENAKKREEGHE